MMMMKRNERDMEISIKLAELKFKISKEAADIGLSDGEFVMLLSSLLSSRAKYMIRFERHGDYETPGGLAGETPPLQTFIESQIAAVTSLAGKGTYTSVDAQTVVSGIMSAVKNWANSST